ncbi:hypothetical protein KUV57_13475 [Epibacterium sp. DP7N7-1]|nr:hypothetical protein [Epibacterium sp. DP7N7-1]
MSNVLNEALKSKGMNANYEGKHARLLPISTFVLEEYPGLANAKIGKQIVAGDMIVTWRGENGKPKGEVLDPLAENELSIMVRKSDGEDHRVDASSIGDAVERLTVMLKEDRENRSKVDADNAKGRKDHRAAIVRGDIDEDEEFVPAKPHFADSAFENLDSLVGGLKARLSAEYGNAFSGLAGKTHAALGELQVTNATRNTLSAEDLSKAKEAHALRAEIDKLENNTPDAVPAEREHGQERVEAALEGLRTAGEGFSAAQMAALSPNAELVTLAFKPLTTANPREIQARRLDARGVNTVMQDLRRFEDTEWAPGAIANTRALLQDRMPGYDFQAKVFSRDGADMMMVADHAGAVLYVWDSETRVQEFDTASDLKVFTADDVPTDEDLEVLRAQARDLRYDAGGEEIDFSFGDDEDEEPVLES